MENRAIEDILYLIEEMNLEIRETRILTKDQYSNQTDFIKEEIRRILMTTMRRGIHHHVPMSSMESNLLKTWISMFEDKFDEEVSILPK